MEEPEAKKPRVEAADGPGDAMQVDDDGPGTSGCAHNPTPAPPASVQQLMSQYYSRLFPHTHFSKWLAYGNDSKQPQADTSFFQRREFCFTMDGDIFVRYQAFRDGAELADAITRKCPSKIDIGPVYSCNPQERRKYEATGGFVPVERELVFDIDLTDYDDVRTCGKEGHICAKCWPLMAVAIQVIDRGLRQDFGFSNVFARKLTDEQRSAVAAYFTVFKGRDADKLKVALGAGGDSLHPALEAARALLAGVWPLQKLLVSQRYLEDEAITASMLRLLPDEALAQAVRDRWAGLRVKGGEDVNLARWRALQECVATRLSQEAKKSRLYYQLSRCLSDILFAHAYPRLDVEVSRKMNHLLKAPFCVHPKTGRVCVPIDPVAAHTFHPDGVPTVHSLLAELGGSRPAAKNTEEWAGTSLAPAVQLFQKAFLEGCQRAGREQLAGVARASAATLTYAF